jgi:hypothetical protein
MDTLIAIFPTFDMEIELDALEKSMDQSSFPHRAADFVAISFRRHDNPRPAISQPD